MVIPLMSGLYWYLLIVGASRGRSPRRPFVARNIDLTWIRLPMLTGKRLHGFALFPWMGSGNPAGAMTWLTPKAAENQLVYLYQPVTLFKNWNLSVQSTGERTSDSTVTPSTRRDVHRARCIITVTAAPTKGHSLTLDKRIIEREPRRCFCFMNFVFHKSRIQA